MTFLFLNAPKGGGGGPPGLGITPKNTIFLVLPLHKHIDHILDILQTIQCTTFIIGFHPLEFFKKRRAINIYIYIFVFCSQGKMHVLICGVISG